MLPALSSKRMIAHRRNKRNRRYNKQRIKMIYAMSRREGENQDRVSVYVDGSHKEQGHHKEVSDLLPQKYTLFI